MLDKDSKIYPIIPNDSSYENEIIEGATVVVPKQSPNYKKIILGLIIGQVLSILSVMNGLCSQYLEIKRMLMIPLILNSIYYLFLFILWIIITRKVEKPKIIYIIIAIIDSQANFICVYTFGAVKFEYPFIINFSSSIWSFFMTLIFVKKYKYRLIHFISVLISLIGVVLTLVGTFKNLSDVSLMFQNVKGLLLCLASSILYAITSILQEIYLDKNENIRNYFVWTGGLGTLITFLESFIFSELNILINYTNYDFWIIFAMICFGLILMGFASIAPFYIGKFSAVMFNVGLASTVFWSYIGNLILNGDEANEKNVFYFVGFAIIIIGLVIFYYRDVQIISKK